MFVEGFLRCFEVILGLEEFLLEIVELCFVFFSDVFDSGLVLLVGVEEFIDFILMVVELDFIFIEFGLEVVFGLRE